MELVRELSMDGILYMPGPEEITSTTDTSKGASLNRVLRKIYPRGTTPKVTDLIAFLDDDQVLPHCSFLSCFLLSCPILPACLLACLLVCLSVCMCLSDGLFVCLSVCALPVCLSVSIDFLICFGCFSACLSIYHPSSSLSVCLCVSIPFSNSLCGTLSMSEHAVCKRRLPAPAS